MKRKITGSRINKSSGLNYYEYCHIQFSDTVKVPGSNASRKKNNSVIKQRKDSNSFFSKVICKEGYYHLLSFLNNQDQLLDKLWKLICCVLCVACLWGYFSLQTFIFIRLSIFTNKAFVFLQDGRRYIIQLMRKKNPSNQLPGYSVRDIWLHPEILSFGISGTISDQVLSWRAFSHQRARVSTSIQSCAVKCHFLSECRELLWHKWNHFYRLNIHCISFFYVL